MSGPLPAVVDGVGQADFPSQGGYRVSGPLPAVVDGVDQTDVEETSLHRAGSGCVVPSPW